MLYANTDLEKSTEAFPKGRAKCPTCDAVVIAKCGKLVVHHWAHEASEDCDSFSEPETFWHKTWKEYFPPEQREVTVGNHRADILTPNGVVEFQHSHLSLDKVKEREDFYNSETEGLTWVVDGGDFAHSFELREKYDTSRTFSFRWKHPRRSWAAAGDIYIDFSKPKKRPTTRQTLETRISTGVKLEFIEEVMENYDEDRDYEFGIMGAEADQHLFHIKKIHWNDESVGGWGQFVSLESFIQEMNIESMKRTLTNHVRPYSHSREQSRKRVVKVKSIF